MQTTVASAPQVRWRGLTITIASLLAIGIATMLPEPGQPPGQHFCLVCGSFGSVDAFLNVLLFAPLGIGLALAGISGKRARLAMFCLSALIETTQYFFIPGRDSTVGDVVTNTLGGALGFALARYTWVWLRPSTRMATILTVAWGAVWLVIQSIVNYSFVPSLPDSLYYGQLARSIGNLPVFEGHVFGARAGDAPITNSALASSQKIRRALLDGEPVVAMVAPAAATPGIAPIVRVADSQKREIVLLAQQGQSLVFAIRSGAAALRLRSPLFGLTHAFPVEEQGDRLPGSDTLTLSGSYVAGDLTMTARTKSTGTRRRIPFTASLGWVLVLPLNWLIEDTRAEFLLSCIWTACLLIPFGYWATRVAPGARVEHRVPFRPLLSLLAALSLFAIGLALIPRGFGLPMASNGDLLSALAGVLLGCGLAIHVGEQS